VKNTPSNTQEAFRECYDAMSAEGREELDVLIEWLRVCIHKPLSHDGAGSIIFAMLRCGYLLDDQEAQRLRRAAWVRRTRQFTRRRVTPIIPFDLEEARRAMNRQEVETIVLDARAINKRPNLRVADLREAYLSEADLSRADLSAAYLSRANLSKANLREANLREANLSGTDLSETNLSKADLRGAKGLFATAQLGRHDAVAAGGYIVIGCERHEYQHWLDHGEEIGRVNEYTDAEIARYMGWIRLVVPWLVEEEAKAVRDE